MNLSKETQAAIKKILPKWEKIQLAFFQPKEKSWEDMETPIGTLYWANPNILFLLTTHNEESYEGSQTQIGLSKDGRLMWEYQSHCSCNGYETSHDHGKELEVTKKTYELNDVPLDWEHQIRENIEKLLKAYAELN